ncbi:MAG: 23S rRNA (guanosine(2251)-2'-O)-methyltransferase RlmB [Saprospiraceae bacterium]|nr:23S rRNA (guanosine(2251)-2'-O)-methyltransferase RlmB [Saprospiraceae bacterium]
MSDIIFGKNPLIEAAESGVEIEKVFMLNTLRGETEVYFRQYCKNRNIPLAKVPEVKLNELARNKSHQGLVAIISPIRYFEIEDVLAQIFERGETPLIMVADSVSDVRNIGSLARSAHFFGAHAVVMTGNASGRINEEAVKASAGALLKIPVCRYASIFNLVSTLQSHGILVYAAAITKNSRPPDETDFTLPAAILLGAEDKGLNPKLFDLADGVVHIPAAASFDSLNVSVAGAVLMYEAQRQRKS